MRSQNVFFGLETTPLFVDTDIIHAIKNNQAFPFHFCILQVIKNWMV